jgi:hypothetical protein
MGAESVQGMECVLLAKCIPFEICSIKQMQRDSVKATYIDRPATPHPQRPPVAPLHLSTAPSRPPLPNRSLPIPTIPHLDRAILSRRRHIPPPLALIHTNADYRPQVREKAHGGVR